MPDAEVLRRRLASQLLATRAPRAPLEIVRWFGAMQSQDLESGLWSIGVRGDGLTRAQVHEAIEDRQILRTWPMRGTIHFVPAVDARWMLELVGTRALATAARRRRELGLDEATVHRAAELLGDALAGGVVLTRAECLDVLDAAGISTEAQRGYHMLWFASQIGVICIGPQRGSQQTFVLLDDWVPDPVRHTREEGLLELFVRFFRSHGPATRHDAARWTGLTLTDATAAIDAASDRLVRVPAADGEWIMSAEVAELSLPTRRAARSDLLLLSGFDEFILGYRSREPMVEEQFVQRIVPGNNGMFMSTIVDGGRVLGTWRRTVRRGGLDVRLQPFATLSARQLRGIGDAAERYRAFTEAWGVAVQDDTDSGEVASDG